MIFPDPLRAIVAFFRSVARFFARKPVFSTPEEVQHRSAICKPCENYENGQCLVCTCFVSLKVRLQAEYCPIGKWGEFPTGIKRWFLAAKAAVNSYVRSIKTFFLRR